MKKVKMTFEVIVPFNTMADEETFKKEFKNDIHELAKYLFREEGIWWREEMELVKTRIINKLK